MTARPTVVLADDHRVVIEGIKRILEPEYDVVAMVEDGDQLVAAVRELHPDVIVADISMPVRSGLAALREIRRLDEAARVVLLTMHQDGVYAATALEEGALGYVLKQADPSELLDALRAALDGRTYVSPELRGELEDVGRTSGPSTKKLSQRQREILMLVSKGRALKQIATDLGISVKTVEYHKYRLMEQLGVRTTAELVRLSVGYEVDDV